MTPTEALTRCLWLPITSCRSLWFHRFQFDSLRLLMKLLMRLQCQGLKVLPLLGEGIIATRRSQVGTANTNEIRCWMEGGSGKGNLPRWEGLSSSLSHLFQTMEPATLSQFDITVQPLIQKCTCVTGCPNTN